MADRRALALPNGVNEQITDSDNLLVGQVSATDGTASNPAFRVQSEASGMYSDTSNALEFSVSGTRLLDLTSGQMHLERTGAGVGPIIDIERLDATTNLAPFLGYLKFSGLDSVASSQEYGFMFGYVKDDTAGSETGGIVFDGISGGTTQESFGILGGVIVGDYANVDDPGHGHLAVTGEIISGDGSDSTPAYSFRDETNSGLYRLSSGVLRFSVLGSDVLTISSGLSIHGDTLIDSNGTLTVSDSATDAPFHLTERSTAPSSTSTGDIYLDDGSNTGSGDVGFRHYNGTSWEDVAAAAGSIALPGINQILFVDNGTTTGSEDGTIQNPYHTITNAISAASALSPSSSNKILIMIFPGIYSETMPLTDNYVYFSGLDKDSTIIQSSSIILDLDQSHIAFTNLTFEHTGTSNLIENSADGETDITFNNCSLLATNGSSGIMIFIDYSIDITFNNCIIKQSSQNRSVLDDSAATYGGTLIVHGCYIEGYIRNDEKDLYVYDSRIFSNYDEVLQIRSPSSAKTVWFENCHIENTNGSAGDVATISGDCNWNFLNCNMIAVGSGHYEIACTSVNYPGNVWNCKLARGLGEKTRLLNQPHIVGGTYDFHANLEGALGALGANAGTIELRDNISSGYVTPEMNGSVKLKGNGFTITASASQIFRMGFGATFEIEDLEISGGQIVSNTSGTMKLKNVHMTNGARFRIYSSGSTKFIFDHLICDEASTYALEIEGTSSSFYIFNSYLVGGSGYPAIQFDAANPNVYMAFSGAFHGSGSTNNPVSNPSSAISYRSHHCFFNVAPEDNSNLNNAIDTGQRYNTIDPDAQYSWAL